MESSNYTICHIQLILLVDSIYPEPPKKSKQEKGEGDKISMKSNWRMNEREQEKTDA